MKTFIEYNICLLSYLLTSLSLSFGMECDNDQLPCLKAVVEVTDYGDYLEFEHIDENLRLLSDFGSPDLFFVDYHCWTPDCNIVCGYAALVGNDHFGKHYLFAVPSKFVTTLMARHDYGVGYHYKCCRNQIGSIMVPGQFRWCRRGQVTCRPGDSGCPDPFPMTSLSEYLSMSEH